MRGNLIALGVTLIAASIFGFHSAPAPPPPEPVRYTPPRASRAAADLTVKAVRLPLCFTSPTRRTKPGLHPENTLLDAAW